MNEIKFALLAVVLMPGLTACDRIKKSTDIHPPGNEALAACSLGKLENTPITCETVESAGTQLRFVPVAPDNTDITGVTCENGECVRAVQVPVDAPQINLNSQGLIIFVESGTWEGNAKANVPGFSALFQGDTIPVPLRDHMRTFMTNLVLAQMKSTIQRNPKKYDHIYLVQGDAKLETIYLQTLDKATKTHGKVDIFMWAHGNPGSIVTSADMESEELTSTELVQFATTKMSPEQRNRVRAIFQTNCYMTRRPANNSDSMYEAYLKVFNQAYFYGSPAINFFPLHKDAVAFENYYRTGDFKSSIAKGVNLISRTTLGTSRQYVVMPAVKGKGCVSVVGVEKCMEQTQVAPNVVYTNAMFLGSFPKIHNPGDPF